MCISQIYLTHDCEYTVIASKEKLQKLEKERQRLLEQMHLEEAGTLALI